MLSIDPAVCIDCGACVTVCPVDAIAADYDLSQDAQPFIDLNALYYQQPEHQNYTPRQQLAERITVSDPAPTLKLAIIGSGPAAMYAAEALLARRPNVQVDVFERLPALGGLVRYGVAPDHQRTKNVHLAFERTARRPGCRVLLNVEIGRDISLDDLSHAYHGVIHASGATSDRALGVPGEALAGSHSATEFVAWYNGHPDHAQKNFDLSSERAVAIGNGNVALDVARILLADPEALAHTDMNDRAIEALRHSRVREVVVVGRRGPTQAALSIPELYGLARVEGLDIAVEPAVAELGNVFGAATTPHALHKAEELKRIASRPVRSGAKRLVFRFLSSPVEIVGTDCVTGVRLARNDLIDDGHGDLITKTRPDSELLDCGLLIRAVGYRGSRIPGLSFDEDRGIVPNSRGRVLDPETSTTVTGQYVAGWIKRGPSGVIGTNKLCAGETVQSILDDFAAGRLAAPQREIAIPDSAVPYAGWERLDRYEREQGDAARRPRVKVCDWSTMVEIARST
jgi:ferredoxin--NADP+ reductase